MEVSNQVAVTFKVTGLPYNRAKGKLMPTLTSLYNTLLTWLNLANKRLDAVVFVAYGWKSDLTGEEILKKLLALNLAGAGYGK
jgi:hypothetical protein